ncbi:hypothetical protein MUK42_17145 [Musa troglodytarum]|uniref:Uncharacterized protein n=1 Tax=Musa troglodytarum TaxID=320322 RepID=A0A9E7HGK3_9LILI|nr:hypothetical protein MUK42_17145 [Musa troglodytarum]
MRACAPRSKPTIGTTSAGDNAPPSSPNGSGPRPPRSGRWSGGSTVPRSTSTSSGAAPSRTGVTAVASSDRGASARSAS